MKFRRHSSFNYKEILLLSLSRTLHGTNVSCPGNILKLFLFRCYAYLEMMLFKLSVLPWILQKSISLKSYNPCPQSQQRAEMLHAVKLLLLAKSLHQNLQGASAGLVLAGTSSGGCDILHKLSQTFSVSFSSDFCALWNKSTTVFILFSPVGVASRTTYPPHCPSDVAGQGYCCALLTHYQLSCQQTDTRPVVFL